MNNMGKINDLTGQKFENLTVLCFTKIEKNKSKFLCRCYCGNDVEVYGYSLKSGKKKSCGCLEFLNKKQQVFRTKNIEGNKYGKLTVIRQDYSHWEKIRWHGARFLCKCDCGGTKIAQSNDLIQGNLVSCGCVGNEKRKEKLKKFFSSFKETRNCKYCLNNFICFWPVQKFCSKKCSYESRRKKQTFVGR
jgi:hypothetical protein